MSAFATPSDRDRQPVQGSSRRGASRSDGSRALDCPGGWAKNGRTREARFLKVYQQKLLAHLGGHEPSPVELALVRRTARLALHLELADERALTGTDPPAQAQRNYAALNSQFLRCLHALGIKKPTEPAGPTLAEVVASGRKR
jgi:hypothetical protein